MSRNTRKVELSSKVVRAARKCLKTVVLMSRGTESIPTGLGDISASGVRLHLPNQWSGHTGETWVLDMIFGEDLHIHLEAAVTRVTDTEIGMAYSWIPDEEQAELWSLLGDYADKVEVG